MKLATSIVLLASTLFSEVIAATAGCGKTPSKVKAGTNTLTVNGKSRQWILTLPANYNNTYPYRLIYGVHWRDGTFTDVANGGQIRPYYGVPELANNTAIFISPNGLNKGWANTGGEDITLFREINKAVDAELCINEKLRFSIGWSYGGAMSYSIACTLGQDFRGVAAFSGGPVSGCAGGTDPVAYFGQHGISDSVLSITLGRQLRDTFVRNNGCTAQSPQEPSRGSGKHILTKYAGCKADKPVWWTAFDGDHTPIPSGSGTNKDTTFTGPGVWDFIKQFE
ncbi:fungal cellulose binding domain-containing protein [Massariosphaeria phaeospora]|uniref:Feruloyl esterase C n=1 Tax=Massariosphaeria phaeospora TaxID=100035 RepID=A0A7C8MCF4_9PLEO|nr:fungal cellulose binding domain-containing protein [Massariosphaeria phaeospora]